MSRHACTTFPVAKSPTLSGDRESRNQSQIHIEASAEIQSEISLGNLQRDSVELFNSPPLPLTCEQTTARSESPPATLSYNSIRLVFPQGRAQWFSYHNLAIARSTSLRGHIDTRISYLKKLKSERSPELDYRHKKFIQSASGVPDVYFHNWTTWASYLSTVDSLIDVAKKHEAWVKLLEQEYHAVAPTWEDFWDISEEMGVTSDSAEGNVDRNINAADPTERNTGARQYPTQTSPVASRHIVTPESVHNTNTDGFLSENSELRSHLHDILQTLSDHNRKRLFLQSKILEGNRSVDLRSFWDENAEPTWIDWGSSMI